MTIDHTLQSLLADLPEVYQPIYGHLDLSSSRDHDSPRMAALESTVDLIARSVNRPLRVLDLGSAQGFTSLTLASLGHHVIGIEMLPANVEVARCLARENPQLSVEFCEGDVADCAELVDLETIDVVLGLSVLHHLVYRDGLEATVTFVAHLADVVPFGVYEMARDSEPLYWAASQPDDPRVTLAAYPFIREVAHSGTHLSDIQRPTLLCSSSHLLIHSDLEAIDSFSRRSHSGVGDAQTKVMRYFSSAKGLTKVAATFADDVPPHILSTLRDDLRREAGVLEALKSARVDAPRLVEFFDGADETSLTKTVYTGDLLSEVVQVCSSDELRSITGDVLTELSELERVGLYHTDLRLWNVVFDRSTRRARLIDHGSVGPVAGDVVWPHDAFYSLIAFLNALWITKVDKTGAELPRTVGLDRPGLPADVVRVIASVLVHERDDRVFQHAAHGWHASATDAGEADEAWPSLPVAWGFIDAIERQRNDYLVARDAARSVAERRHELDRAHLTEALHVSFGERERMQSMLADHERRLSEGVERAALERRHAVEIDALRGRHHAEVDTIRAQLSELDASYRALVARGFSPGADSPLGRDGNERTSAIEAEVAGLAAELAAMRATVSWRVTKPLRALRRRVPRQT